MRDAAYSINTPATGNVCAERAHDRTSARSTPGSLTRSHRWLSGSGSQPSLGFGEIPPIRPPILPPRDETGFTDCARPTLRGVPPLCGDHCRGSAPRAARRNRSSVRRIRRDGVRNMVTVDRRTLASRASPMLVADSLDRPLFYVLQGWLWAAFGFHQALGRVLSLIFSVVLLGAIAWLARTVDADAAPLGSSSRGARSRARRCLRPVHRRRALRHSGCRNGCRHGSPRILGAPWRCATGRRRRRRCTSSSNEALGVAGACWSLPCGANRASIRARPSSAHIGRDCRGNADCGCLRPCSGPLLAHEPVEFPDLRDRRLLRTACKRRQAAMSCSTAAGSAPTCASS